MGKERNLAASVPWANLTVAIQANASRSSGLGFGGAAAAVATMPTETPAVSWLGCGSWTEDTSMTVADAVSVALWVRDPLYRAATPSMRRTMEAEEATALLNVSEAAWREHNGRVRGWVRKHLEEDLRGRSSAGEPAPDFWEAVRTQRRAALLLDYVCVMRSLRLAIWWPEQKTVTVLPAAGGVDASTSVVQLNATSGRILLGSTGYQVTPLSWSTEVLPSAIKTEFQWVPPATVSAISSMTVAQIQEAIVLLDPTAEKTGSRATLWNRFHWLQWLASVRPKPSID
jgi:hypothetical protein